jgi:predicted DNA-binding transcriptional regulator AlpA
MVKQFYRKRDVLRLCGMAKSTLHDAINAGRFPPPDGYIGPQSPFWTAETLAQWQEARLKVPSGVRIRITPRAAPQKAKPLAAHA